MQTFNSASLRAINIKKRSGFIGFKPPEFLSSANDPGFLLLNPTVADSHIPNLVVPFNTNRTPPSSRWHYPTTVMPGITMPLLLRRLVLKG